MRSGLMVSGLDSGSNDAGLSPDQDPVLFSWERRLTFTVLVSTQGYISQYQQQGAPKPMSNLSGTGRNLVRTSEPLT